MKLNLEQKVVLVTGGTKGIGRAIVEGFLAEGAQVFFCSRTQSSIEKANNELISLFPSSRAEGAVVDVTRSEEVRDWVEGIGTKRGIDVVVSNVSSLSVTDESASWKSAYNTDMMGTVSLIQAALPFLVESKGNIVTISSVSGRDIDFTAPSPYGAFKAAMVHYTAQLAHSLAGKGVRANSVAPGNVFVEDGVWGNIEKTNPSLFASQMSANPMGRMGKASEIADAVVFLASERASFISGTNLVVDGSLCTGVQF